MQPLGELERERSCDGHGVGALPDGRPAPPGGAQRRHRLPSGRILVPRTIHDPASGDSPLGRREGQRRRSDHDSAARPERAPVRARRARLRSGQAAILVRGDRARIVGNDISGPGYRNRNTPCILLDGPRDVRIEADRKHPQLRPGVAPQPVRPPGSSSPRRWRTRIVHNVVYHTLGDGIAPAPNAQRTRVARNIVDGNTSGIYIGGGRRTASSYNVVTRNVISNSGHWNVHSAWSGPTGKGNVVASNCLWNGFGGTAAGRGFRLVGGEHQRQPTLPEQASRLRHAHRAVPLDAPADRPDRPTVLPAFRVGYRLRALPNRVQVVRLTLTGLTRGTRISLRCTSRCGTRWTGRAASTLALPVLRGVWLGRGATVEVRATRGGWIGHLARVVVTGLPRGVTIAHGRTA